MKKVQIRMLVTNPETPLPKTAYDGTAAAFDVACAETTTINPGEFKTVPTGQRFSIDESEPFYMQVHLRSSYGFKKGLRCHIGIIDAGYTGDFGVSVVNNTKEPVTINAGDYFAQVLVLEKPKVQFIKMNQITWDEYESLQGRGAGGFGSSGK